VSSFAAEEGDAEVIKLREAPDEEIEGLLLRYTIGELMQRF
jgi:hypothetical protein